MTESFLDNLKFFVVAGAGKSGTTALARFLDSCSDICISEPKEPKFFIHQTGHRKGGSVLGPPHNGRYLKGYEYYRNLFRISDQHAAFGEASTAYFYCHETPELLSSFRSDVKVIFILRNPVERLISQYYYELKVGRRLPSISNLLSDPNSPDCRRLVWGSSYSIHLARFLKWIPETNILLLNYDDVFSEGSSTLSLVRDFLGLPINSVAETNFIGGENRRAKARIGPLAALWRLPSRIGVKQYLPETFHSLIKKIRWKFEKFVFVSDLGRVPSDLEVSSIQAMLSGEGDRVRALLEDYPNVRGIDAFDLTLWEKKNRS